MNISQNPCERIRCSIILRSSRGRLGNRMFMFASAYGLARTHNCRLHISKSILEELSNNFQMKLIDKNMWLSQEELNNLKNIQNQNTVCTFLPELLITNAFKNIELTGYWQSYLYFDAYREEIREIFSARNDTLIRLAEYFTNITKDICPLCLPLPNTTHKELRQVFQTRYNTTWISIHIRRDDFRGLGFASDDDYIRRAITFFRRRYHHYQVNFLVASDDKNYCQELFASEIKSRKIIILPNHFSPADDLMALSLCHHSIVTGGTYGFWSAYLTGGEVIHDVRYKAGCSRSDYYPPWFVLTGSIV
jgi:galactoside 2-L-fucosyltransferase 1/2